MNNCPSNSFLSPGNPLPETREFFTLVELLRGYPDLALAFSGGADSSFLLAVAKVAGIDSILPVSVVTDFLTCREKVRLRRLGNALNIEPVLVSVDILAIPGVAENCQRRCYYCKRCLFSEIRKVARKRGVQTLVHGANLDDLKEFRPGMQAARELGYLAPLVEAGFTKRKIRECSKIIGLETWNLPSQSCLATRIPEGEEITHKKLERVEAVENFLHDLDFVRVRVRCHGDLARIETGLDEFHRLLGKDVRSKVTKAFKGAGFKFVCLDLNGYVPAGFHIAVKE